MTRAPPGLGCFADDGLAESLEKTFQMGHALSERTDFLTRLLAECGELLTRLLAECGELLTRLLAECGELLARLLAECGEILARLLAECGEFVTRLFAEATEFPACFSRGSLAAQNQTRQADRDENNGDYLWSHGLDSVDTAYRSKVRQLALVAY